MKLKPKLIARCEPVIKYDKDGNRLLVAFRRKSNSKKSGQVYNLPVPKILPAIILDGLPMTSIVKDLLEKAKSEIAAEEKEAANQIAVSQ